MSEWLRRLLDELAAGRPVQLKGSGPSMAGRINDGEFVTLRAVDIGQVGIDDIVLAKVPNGRHYVHLVKEIRDGRYLIGNMLGEIDGWVEAGDIKAKVVAVGFDPAFAGVTMADS